MRGGGWSDLHCCSMGMGDVLDSCSTSHADVLPNMETLILTNNRLTNLQVRKERSAPMLLHESPCMGLSL